MLSESKQEQIAHQVIRTLSGRFDKFPQNSDALRNAPFHEAFLQAFEKRIGEHIEDTPFLITLSSWLHGLNTTLGQSFFEKVAHILCDGRKPKFDLRLTNQQATLVDEIMRNLQRRNVTPNLIRENQLLRDAMGQGVEQVGRNLTIDVYFEDADVIHAIELKSVRPNAGEVSGEKRKILSGKAAMMRMFPDKEIRFWLGFPFDPTSSTATGFDKDRFLNNLIDGRKYVDSAEILLADELWSYLSGKPNTMSQLLAIINAIATPNFLEDYEFVRSPENYVIDPVHYVALLQRWRLFSELPIVDNYESVQVAAR